MSDHINFTMTEEDGIIMQPSALLKHKSVELEEQQQRPGPSMDNDQTSVATSGR